MLTKALPWWRLRLWVSAFALLLISLTSRAVLPIAVDGLCVGGTVQQHSTPGFIVFVADSQTGSRGTECVSAKVYKHYFDAQS